jgi:alanyl-tRNA synthetase
MKAADIRQTFLKFFESKGHRLAASASLLIQGDPTLLFTNAGMNQFKDFFLGNSPVRYPRIANSQPCLRVSGKHNDLEDVGKDTYHHTLFEMLGNWSFGDYFKEEAIAWAWELMTGPYGLDPERLYVTYFEGDAGDGLGADEDARRFWAQWIDGERILPGSRKNNFWEMGETGPCGPCSEMHIDLRSQEERQRVDGATLVNQDHPQVIELWNLVFMEFQRMANGRLQALPARHVDTGMGFERLCRSVVMASSNYDTDVFAPLIKAIEERSGKSYNNGDEQVDVAMRVMADHLRAVALIIADGQLPSNAKAGYVCRRILRRAIRYGYTYLGLEQPSMHLLVSVLVDQIGDVLPQLRREQVLIEQTLMAEESNFLRTLAKGLLRIEQWVSEKGPAAQGVMDGETAFELLDTYGFPADLTALVLSEKGYRMDHPGFEKAMAIQRERSRVATKSSTGDWAWADWTAGDTALNGRFVGYDLSSCTTRIVRWRTVLATEGEQVQLVLETTPFYAESGGQVGDQGELVGEDGARVRVLGVTKENNLWIHRVDRLPYPTEQEFVASVNPQWRHGVSAHHSATHLLHSALRMTLGNHVQQKGSLVARDQLRFDFAQPSRITREELQAIEREVNRAVAMAWPLVEERDLSIDQALANGATALFGEKYGDKVRVISFGGSYSMELCGGTHVVNSAEIGWFKIISESAIASGIRRIEAVCGPSAMQWVDNQLGLLEQAHEILKHPADLAAQLRKTVDELSQLRKKLEQSNQQQYDQWVQLWNQSWVPCGNGIQLLVKTCEPPQAESLKTMANRLRSSTPMACVVLGAVVEDKTYLACALGEKLAQTWNAVNLVRHFIEPLGGQGGGQAHLAMAGAPNISPASGQAQSRLHLAIQQAEQYLTQLSLTP